MLTKRNNSKNIQHKNPKFIKYIYILCILYKSSTNDTTVPNLVIYSSLKVFEDYIN